MTMQRGPHFLGFGLLASCLCQIDGKSVSKVTGNDQGMWQADKQEGQSNAGRLRNSDFSTRQVSRLY